MIENIRKEIDQKIADAKAVNSERALKAASLEEAIARYQAEAETAETPEAMASAQSRKAFAERQLATLKEEPKAMAYSSKDEAEAERKRLYAAYAAEAQPVYENMRGIVEQFHDCFEKLRSINDRASDALYLLAYTRPSGEYIYPAHYVPFAMSKYIVQVDSVLMREVDASIENCATFKVVE